MSALLVGQFYYASLGGTVGADRLVLARYLVELVIPPNDLALVRRDDNLLIIKELLYLAQSALGMGWD